MEDSVSNAFDFLLGEWDVEMTVLPEEAIIGRRATMRAYRFLDGRAILDEWRHWDEAGQGIVFRGPDSALPLPTPGEGAGMCSG